MWKKTRAFPSWRKGKKGRDVFAQKSAGKLRLWNKVYKKLTKRRLREKEKKYRGTLFANQSNKQFPRHLPQVSHHPRPRPRRPLCYSCPAFFVDVKDNPPNNTTRLSLISSRYAAEVEIYGPFFCYPEHKSCIRIKVISLSSLSIIFFPTPDSTDIL